MASKHEYAERLNDLKKGPWDEKSQKIKDYLNSLIGYRELTVDKQLIILPEKNDRNEELNEIFRWHISKEITSEKEIELRNSLDSALEYLQLLELAIETGYIDINTIMMNSRVEIALLLWSKPIRSYVKNYNLIAVEYLAKRINIVGFQKNLIPPAIDLKAYVRFALFLSNHLNWHRDFYLNLWIKFLDDFTIDDNEQDEFYSFLIGEGWGDSERFQELLIGAQNFFESLFDLFSALKPKEYARFGLFYSYWLAIFFGYQMSENGFVKNAKTWPDDSCWANAILNALSDLFIKDHINIEEVNYYKITLKKKIKLLETVWKATNSLINNSYTPLNSSTAY